ncbi:hypothetical protein AB5J72_01140 [Streptomyces sp. CG1]|uniref:hypothetical protein n=1 Tax=Streptomyces sp. CG1 TaxID=1287523 RepID=UPI0034E239E5
MEIELRVIVRAAAVALFDGTQDSCVGGELRACCVPPDSDAWLPDCGDRWRRHLADEAAAHASVSEVVGD